MPEKALLPLFPIEIVLLPNERLPLRVFEPRYRTMIAAAGARETEFGLVLDSDGKPAAAGCAARAVRVTEGYAAGRFDIEVRGTRRFRILSLDRSEEVLQGVVEYFEDDSPAQASLGQVETLIALAEGYAKLTRRATHDPFEPNHPLLSFQIAGRLLIAMSVKQKLLESTGEIERVELLAEHFRSVLKRFESRSRMQRLAGANGHAKRTWPGRAAFE